MSLMLSWHVLSMVTTVALSKSYAPECPELLFGGIAQFARRNFVEVMEETHPGLMYDCGLENEAMHGISFYGGFLLDRFKGASYNYFTRKYPESERVRNVINDAVESWKGDLKEMQTKTRFGCNYRVNNLVYSVLCTYA
ncbi:hypothetical protein Y032_0002g551 [Ancylostoma ceylanicum]|uniref:SCP domain-containing protein n=3 Tax=Ancylostoma ceylanicum TaxID=53326 RepID=A0A016W159_9BILA|nr:hypothetical protein Y032_0002g551 [Ancylostoma ceylanicum]